MTPRQPIAGRTDRTRFADLDARILATLRKLRLATALQVHESLGPHAPPSRSATNERLRCMRRSRKVERVSYGTEAVFYRVPT